MMTRACPYCYSPKGMEPLPAVPGQVRCMGCYLTLPVELALENGFEVRAFRTENRTKAEVEFQTAVNCWLFTVQARQFQVPPSRVLNHTHEVGAFVMARHAYLNMLSSEV